MTCPGTRWQLLWVVTVLLAGPALCDGGVASTAGNVEVLVEVTTGGPAAEPAEATLRLERLGVLRDGDQPTRETERSVILRAPGSVPVELVKGEVWRVVLDAPHLWAPPVIWTEEHGSRLVLQAVPRGELIGRLRWADETTPPEVLTARFQRAGSEIAASRRSWTTECGIEEAGSFTCAVPSGLLDVRLRSPGFLSHYLWDAAVPQGGPLDLGDLELVAGASVVAWVAAEGAAQDFDVRQVLVDLVPETAGFDTTAKNVHRRELLRVEGRPNERGFVEFTGVPPGSYRLRARHRSFAEAVLAPVLVLAGAETEVDQVVLRPPVRLSVGLEPPTDVRKRPWIVTVLRHGEVPGHLDKVAGGAADRDGNWVQDGLPPGRYRISVADGTGARWARREIRVEGDGDEEVRIDLPFEAVEGRVTLGGEPLPGASVWFGGRHGETRISAVSDEEGSVYVIVPVREEWPVEVRAKEPPVSARLDLVEVRDHPAQPWRLAEIDLPRTGLSGVVMRDDGGPVPRADVRIMREEPPVRYLLETTDDEGAFRVRGLRPGRWRVQAEWRDEDGTRWMSDGLAAAIPEQGHEDVELVLRRPWRLSGQIAGPTGAPVPGAEVTGVPVYPGSGERASYVATAVTGLAGEFWIEMPAEATAVRLTVLPPGFAARQWPPVERGAPPQILTVEPHGGTLRIRGISGGAASPLHGQPGVFALDRWSLPTLAHWARMAGGKVPSGPGDELIVPAMAPGRYALCPSGVRPGAGAAECVAGELLPYSELILVVP